jgi:predicted  nucleic acid-binding Zn-ribbon protein
MNKLNRPLAQAIYDLEDAVAEAQAAVAETQAAVAETQAAVAETQAAVANAFTALRASIDAEKDRIQNSFTGIIDGIKERLDVVNEALQQSRSIYDLLANALRSQQVSGDAAFAGRRSAAQSFLRGGDFRDEEQLREALSVVAEPSEGLFSSFVDYARDFGQTSFLIEEAKKIAEVQLTADEKQVLLLEEQIVSAEASRDAQLEALEQQYQIEVNQYNALLGIDTSVKSVTEAIGTLRGAIAAMASAQKAQAAAVKDAAVASIVSPISGSIESKAKAEADLLAAQGVISSTSATEKYTYKTGGFFGIGRKTKKGTRDNPVYTQLQKDIEALSNTIAKEEQILAPAREQLESIGVVPTFAKGGMHSGGMRLVGEQGPELEATGPSRIFSHNQTASMFKDPDLKDAVRSLKEEVAGLRSEQRQIQMDISKYTKRTYDIERKWDVEGLPATRT